MLKKSAEEIQALYAWCPGAAACILYTGAISCYAFSALSLEPIITPFPSRAAPCVGSTAKAAYITRDCTSRAAGALARLFAVEWARGDVLGGKRWEVLAGALAAEQHLFPQISFAADALLRRRGGNSNMPSGRPNRVVYVRT